MSADIQELLGAVYEDKMNNQYTSIPCIVLAVRDNLTGQMVDIQPTINQKSPDGTVAERPPILGVPVSFPVSSTAGMTFPIKAGDTGMAVFSMRSMDAWKAGNGRASTPTTFAKMDKGDAVFYPGIQPPGVAVNNPAKHVLTHSTEDTVLFQNLGGGAECEVRLSSDGSINITTSNQPVTINCSSAVVNATQSIGLNTQNLTVDAPSMTFIGNITHIGDYTQTGTYVLNAVNINLHKHVGVTTGNGISGTMV
jgi:hypothetical protein